MILDWCLQQESLYFVLWTVRYILPKMFQLTVRWIIALLTKKHAAGKNFAVLRLAAFWVLEIHVSNHTPRVNPVAFDETIDWYIFQCWKRRKDFVPRILFTVKTKRHRISWSSLRKYLCSSPIGVSRYHRNDNCPSARCDWLVGNISADGCTDSLCKKKKTFYWTQSSCGAPTLPWEVLSPLNELLFSEFAALKPHIFLEPLTVLHTAWLYLIEPSRNIWEPSILNDVMRHA